MILLVSFRDGDQKMTIEKDRDLENFWGKDLNLKVFVTTNGCSENRIDCAKMKNFFIKNGWTVADNLNQADLILFNACGLTTVRENDSLETLKYINNLKKSSAEVIVWGCFPKINPQRLSAIHQGVMFDSYQEERLEDFFEGSIRSELVHANFLVDACCNTKGKLKSLLPKKIRNRVTFMDPTGFPIKISTGCLDACAYCGVRLSRGRLRSKPINNVVEEFKEGLAKGFSNFTMIGTDLGAYGRDISINLVELLNTIMKIEGNYKIRFPNINPRWLPEMLPELLAHVGSGKIEVFGSGVQCGSNKILKLMNRQYSIEDFRMAIGALKAAHPVIRIRTNLIVGFPGETEQDFQETLRLLDELDITYADIHKYSPRPKTKAATLPDQVPSSVIEERYTRLKRHFWYTFGKHYLNSLLGIHTHQNSYNKYFMRTLRISKG